MSDDLIVAAIPDHEVIQVRYFRRKRLIDKITQSVMMSADRLILRWWQRGNGPSGNNRLNINNGSAGCRYSCGLLLSGR